MPTIQLGFVLPNMIHSRENPSQDLGSRGEYTSGDDLCGVSSCHSNIALTLSHLLQFYYSTTHMALYTYTHSRGKYMHLALLLPTYTYCTSYMRIYIIDPTYGYMADVWQLWQRCVIHQAAS